MNWRALPEPRAPRAVNIIYFWESHFEAQACINKLPRVLVMVVVGVSAREGSSVERRKRNDLRQHPLTGETSPSDNKLSSLPSGGSAWLQDARLCLIPIRRFRLSRLMLSELSSGVNEASVGRLVQAAASNRCGPRCLTRGAALT